MSGEEIKLSLGPVEARILPDRGANLYSLKVGGTEILHGPENLEAAPGFMGGNPVLYPMPNRVAGARFCFDGRLYRYPANERTHFLHGLVHSLPWTQEGSSGGSQVRLTLAFRPGDPLYEIFPFAHSLSLEFELLEDGIEIRHSIQNQDWKRLPFGLGYHPWFRVLGERAQTLIQVPARWNMEDSGLIPSGRMMDLDGLPLDLREARSLEGLDLDTVYAGLEPRSPMRALYKDMGLELRLEASSVFRYAVIYTPKGKPYFCMENQTCATDAHNLYARGLEQESGLVVLDPGQSHFGWVSFRLKKL